MARKEKTVFALLTHKPWWFSAGIAIAVYAVLAYGLPLFSFEGKVAKGFAEGMIYHAPVFALLFLIPAAVSARRAWLKRKM
jgi:hypothetical protein